jgi:hypothetical protein
MSARLLIAFGAAGGAPPATMESLRVLEDGTARAIVGSPWPDGRPLDEAGLYQTLLSDADLAALRDLAGDESLRATGGEYGPIRADSGASSLSLGEDITIRWGAFAELPAPVPAAVATLREVLARVREHPVAVLRLRAGDPIELSNPGTQPVRYGVQLRAGDGDNLSAYHAAVPISAADGALGPGETVAVGGDGQGRSVFARGALEVVVDERPLALDAFIVAR